MDDAVRMNTTTEDMQKTMFVRSARRKRKSLQRGEVASGIILSQFSECLTEANGQKRQVLIPELCFVSGTWVVRSAIAGKS